MNKPTRSAPRPLAQIAHGALADAFRRQGFASNELIVRWKDIVGADIAAHSEPVKLQWPRSADPEQIEPATLVLRVEGPVALEIQQLKPVICARVNQFLGWRAVGDVALRQAPLSRRTPAKRRQIDPDAAARETAALTAIEDDDLRAALGRLGAAIKQP